jgi:hypothetical protein
VIDLKIFQDKYEKFPSKYVNDFDSFWKWKIRVENETSHVLDRTHIENTFNRLSIILRGWQAYRNGQVDWEPVLMESLGNISKKYDILRKYNLLTYEEIPVDVLQKIWSQLGRVKEAGEINDSHSYHIIAVCKPLMLLWGQTMAFDINVRNHLAGRFNCPRSNTWSFEEWDNVMKGISNALKESPIVTQYFTNLATQKYGQLTMCPFGRFLDIFYF